MQSYKYLLLSFLLISITTTSVKPTNVSKEEIESIINKLLNERFAENQKYMKRIIPRRLLYSPVKLVGVVGLVGAWGYWFTQTHRDTCKKMELAVCEGLLAAAELLKSKKEESQQDNPE